MHYSVQSYEMESELFSGRKFSDFANFQTFFEEYTKRTKQIFCVAFARTVERHNRSRSKKLDPKLRYAHVKYQCKCGGRERHRGAGIRPVQK